MKTKLSTLVTSTVTLLLSACGLAGIAGSGRIISEQRAVSGFSQVVFAVPGDLTIIQDGSEGLLIEGDDNLLPHIKTSVKDGVLIINLEPGIHNLVPTQKIRFTLNADVLTRIALNGSGDIRSESLSGDNLDLDLNGSGNFLIGVFKSEKSTFELDGSGNFTFEQIETGPLTVRLDGSGNIAFGTVTATTAEMVINGSGKLSARGNLDRQSIVINGSGGVRAGGLESQSASVTIVGSGNVEIWVEESLEALITGSGNINYRGKPRISQNITGSGKIRSVLQK